MYDELGVTEKPCTCSTNIFSMPCLFSRAAAVSVHWSTQRNTLFVTDLLQSCFLFPSTPAVITKNFTTLYDDVWSTNGIAEHVSSEIFTVPNWVRQLGTFWINIGYLLRAPLVLLLIPYLKSEACDVPDRTGCYGDDYNFTGDWESKCQTKHQYTFWKKAFSTKKTKEKGKHAQ